MNTIIYYFGAAYATFPLWLPFILIAVGVFWTFRKDSPDHKVLFPTKLVPIVFILVGLLVLGLELAFWLDLSRGGANSLLIGG